MGQYNVELSGENCIKVAMEMKQRAHRAWWRRRVGAHSTLYVRIRCAACVRAFVRSRDHHTPPSLSVLVVRKKPRKSTRDGENRTPFPPRPPSLSPSLLAAVWSIAQERQRMGNVEGEKGRDAEIPSEYREPTSNVPSSSTAVGCWYTIRLGRNSSCYSYTIHLG